MCFFFLFPSNFLHFCLSFSFFSFPPILLSPSFSPLSTLLSLFLPFCCVSSHFFSPIPYTFSHYFPPFPFPLSFFRPFSPLSPLCFLYFISPVVFPLSSSVQSPTPSPIIFLLYLASIFLSPPSSSFLYLLPFSPLSCCLFPLFFRSIPTLSFIIFLLSFSLHHPLTLFLFSPLFAFSLFSLLLRRGCRDCRHSMTTFPSKRLFVFTPRAIIV